MPTDEKLRIWKNFRNELGGIGMPRALTHVAKFFSTVPIGARAVDYYTPSDWPTPWEIIHSGACCPSATSLLIFHTLAMSSLGVELAMYLVDDSYDTYLLPVVDGTHVLNYESNTVSELAHISDKMQVLKVFGQNELKKMD